MKTIISGFVIMSFVLITMLPTTNLNAQSLKSSSKPNSAEKYVVMSVPQKTALTPSVLNYQKMAKYQEALC